MLFDSGLHIASSYSRMEGVNGKLFVGGISWDTNEDHLREYFQSYGEVVEVVIMKDRITGRGRGFGFVVFVDPLVADRVVKAKHVIDGRTVEAKKAVPRDAQIIVNRNNSSTHSSPGLASMKKIFVGGLPSSVTETDFKRYFDQFGTITDVVVMYDHHTLRPRGFGFITYDSEDSVDKVLFRNFHELNGKMVEVKRAVPKESSPVPSRSLQDDHTYSLNRVASFPNVYTHGYNPNSVRDYGIRMDGRFSPPSVGRSAYLPFNSSTYGLGSTYESGLGSTYGGIGTLGSTVGLGRDLLEIQEGFGALNTLHGGTRRRNYDPMAHDLPVGGTRSLGNSASYNVWGNKNFTYNSNFLNPSDGTGLDGGSIGSLSAFDNTRGLWSSVVGQDRRTGTPMSDGISNRFGESDSVNGVGFSRNTVNSIGATSPYGAKIDLNVRNIENLYGEDSLYGEVPGSFTQSHVNSASDITPNNSVSYIGYRNGSHRGIAA